MSFGALLVAPEIPVGGIKTCVGYCATVFWCGDVLSRWGHADVTSMS